MSTEYVLEMEPHKNLFVRGGCFVLKRKEVQMNMQTKKFLLLERMHTQKCIGITEKISTFPCQLLTFCFTQINST